MTAAMIAKLGASADCQYAIGNCHLPHTGLRLEHAVGLALIAILIGATLLVIAYRLLHD